MRGRGADRGAGRGSGQGVSLPARPRLLPLPCLVPCLVPALPDPPGVACPPRCGMPLPQKLPARMRPAARRCTLCAASSPTACNRRGGSTPRSCCTSCAAAACWRWRASRRRDTPPDTCTTSLRSGTATCCRTRAQVGGRHGQAATSWAAGRCCTALCARAACMVPDSDLGTLDSLAHTWCSSSVPFAMLLPWNAGQGGDSLEVCRQLLAHFKVEPSQYQIGRTRRGGGAGTWRQLAASLPGLPAFARGMRALLCLRPQHACWHLHVGPASMRWCTLTAGCSSGPGC